MPSFHGYLHRTTRPRSDPDAAVRADLRTIHTECRGAYERPRLIRALRERVHSVSSKRVARLMREEGLRGKCKARFRPCTTDSRHHRPVVGNLLERHFHLDEAPPAWAGDVTYIPAREGWLYLAVVISLQTRQLLGFSLSERMPDELVRRAFVNARSTTTPLPGTLFHPDRGSQYAGRGFRNVLAACRFVQSMSRKGNCWDSAVTESFFATLRNEEAAHAYAARAEARTAIAWYI